MVAIPKPPHPNFAFIACIPVVATAAVSFKPYKDSTISRCSQCGQDVYVGPESWKVHEAKQTPLWCVLCLGKEHGMEVVAKSMLTLPDHGVATK